MHLGSAVQQVPAADGGMPDFGQMRKAELMQAAKAIGVLTRRQCTRDDGSTCTVTSWDKFIFYSGGALIAYWIQIIV